MNRGESLSSDTRAKGEGATATDRNQVARENFTKWPPFGAARGRPAPCVGYLSPSAPFLFMKKRYHINRQAHAEIRDADRFIEFDLWQCGKLLASGAHLKAAGWDFAAIVNECKTIVAEARQPFAIPRMADAKRY